jgi:hypothetical protein
MEFVPDKNGKATTMSKTEPKSFAFIPNLLDVQFESPIEIVPGHTFKRAEDYQQDMVHGFINRFKMFLISPNIYEYQAVLRSGTSSFEPLEKPNWRYFVCEFAGNNAVMCDLAEASALTPIHLRFIPTFVLTTPPAEHERASYAIVAAPGLWELFGDFSPFSSQILRLVESDLSDLRTAYDQMLDVRSKFVGLHRACSMFHRLCTMASHSNLSVLGYFSVIESLLTHNPHGDYDSLGHQIRTKMSLLSNRFAEPIDYKVFGDLTPDRAWSKLYEFRSRIAHGAELTFDGSLKALVNSGTVEDFLRETTRLILRQALREPQLFADLQAC